MYHSHSKHGFSLLEITISIAIIALLVAAVTVASNVKDKANFNTMVDDINDIATAVGDFQTSYSGLPGDLYNATNYFGSIVDNGDGNGVIETVNIFGDENRDFWQHLSRAGLITGNFDGGSSNEPGVGAMEAPFKNTGYFAASTDTTSTATLAIIVGRYDASTFTTSTASPEGALSPEIVQKYDQTYDDGDATTGNVTAIEGSNFIAGNCHTAGVYNSLSEDDACIMHVVIVE